jgi:hypothetical protein
MARRLSIPVNIGKQALQAQEGRENQNILGGASLVKNCGSCQSPHFIKTSHIRGKNQNTNDKNTPKFKTNNIKFGINSDDCRIQGNGIICSFDLLAFREAYILKG